MAFLIGYWGSSYKKWFAAKMFFFYSAVASLPAMAAVLYLYHSLEGKLDYLYVLEKLNTLSYGERWFV
jgi:NADH:ubiquinone oxidoreductase subunit 4 (subunit M)